MSPFLTSDSFRTNNRSTPNAISLESSQMESEEPYAEEAPACPTLLENRNHDPVRRPLGFQTSFSSPHTQKSKHKKKKKEALESDTPKNWT